MLNNIIDIYKDVEDKEYLKTVLLKNKEIVKQIDYINALINNIEIEEAIKEIYNLITLSEKMTMYVRQIPFHIGDIEGENKMVQIIEDVLDIKAQNTWYGAYIKMNTILPKKAHSSAGAKSYIRASLHSVLETKRLQGEIERVVEPSVLVIRHNYNNIHEEQRDHDNIETKAVIDTVVDFYLIDDTPELLSHFHESKETDEKFSFTEIFIVKRSLFMKWYNEYSLKGR